MIKLIAVGDIFLKSKNNRNPLKKIKEPFSSSDIVFGNLETVLSNKGKEVEKRFPLRTDPGKICYLKDVGFNIVNIANNHIMDYGEIGLVDTINILEKSNIKFIGAGRNIEEALKPIIFEKDGLKIGFLGFTSVGLIAKEKSSGCAPLDKGLIFRCVSGLREKVDILIVSLHWGVEYVFYPSPEQQRLARAIIDNGADLIIGHHPHVIQGIEEYKNKLIFYSLGNCNFGVCQDKNYDGADLGLIVSVEFSKEKGITNYKLIPIRINTDYVPLLLRENEKLEVLEFVKKISSEIKNKISSNFWFEEASSIYLSSQIKSYFVRIGRYGVAHFFAFVRWLISPFTLRMILGWVSKKFKRTLSL